MQQPSVILVIIYTWSFLLNLWLSKSFYGFIDCRNVRLRVTYSEPWLGFKLYSVRLDSSKVFTLNIYLLSIFIKFGSLARHRSASWPSDHRWSSYRQFYLLIRLVHSRLLLQLDQLLMSSEQRLPCLGSVLLMPDLLQLLNVLLHFYLLLNAHTTFLVFFDHVGPNACLDLSSR